MKTLYIIGNGFDLHHNLPTQYSDFSKYIQKKNVELYNTLENCCKFDYKWRDFEDKLDTFSINSLSKYNEEFRKYDGVEYNLSAILVQAKERIRYLPNDLNNWIFETIDYPDLKDVEEPIDFQSEALFLTFNYTKTLENVYNIENKNIWHIHNFASKVISNKDNSFPDELQLSDIIVGYDENKKISVPNFEFENQICGTNFEEILSWLKKKTHSIIKKNQTKFYQYNSVEKVIILGHSLGDCDIPYFQEIEKRISSGATFEISYYNDNAKQDLENQSSKFKGKHTVYFKKFKEFCK